VTRLRGLMFAGVALVAIGVAVLAYALDAAADLERETIDLRFDIRGTEAAPGDIVFVRIDDKTFDELGVQFQNFRPFHADLLERTAADGAKVVAYDIQFSEESEDPDADIALVEAIRAAGNVVLATTEVNETGVGNIFNGDPDTIEYSRGTPANSNFENDPGRVIRRMALQIDQLRTFPVVTAERALGRKVDVSAFEDGSAWIDFHGPPGTFDAVSFSDVVQGKTPRGFFKDKIVVVGASAPTLQDLHATSTTGGEPMAGPEVHANAISTARRGFPLGETGTPIDIALIALLGVVPLAALRLRALVGFGVALATAALYPVVAQLLFNAGTIVPVIHPLIALALAALGTLVFHYVTAAFERERVRDVFSRFVPENVVGQVLAQAEGARLGGVRLECTVMFTDLRGFTTFSEGRPADEVIEILNRYLTEMSNAILDHGGTLVAYMGDGIFAVFGAPVEMPDHADRAIACGREMLDRLDRFNVWVREQGGEPFRMGVGLNSGPVMSGNVGSERRLEYAAIGDTTNTASRIESMTKGTEYQMFVADSTYSLLSEKPADFVDTGEHEVRGKEHGIRLWGLPDSARVG